VRIGSLELESNLFLSPLAGYTNLPFRLVIREVGGVDLCTTDLVNARSLLEKNPKAFKLIETNTRDRPLAVPGQVGHHEPRLTTAQGDLATADLELLGRALGPGRGAELRERANGIDHRTVETEREPKSESAEITFAEDVSDTGVVHETLDRLEARVCEGLGRSGYRGRTVTVKVRLRPFRTFTRSQTVEAPTRDATIVAPLARELFGRVEVDAPVRLVGVGLSGLERDAAADSDRLFAAEA